MTNMFRSFKRLLLKCNRVFFPKPLPSLEFSSQKWDSEYAAQKWDYMETLPELGRYAMIAGYVSYIKPTASLLEIGCGTGLLFERLKHLPYERYKGVDISEKAIEIANRHKSENTHFASGDGACFKDEKVYDIIIFNESLYYFNDCIAVLEHYKENLSSNGFFIISMVVGDVSNSHWKKIEQRYQIQDAVRITNCTNITWNCKIVQPDAR